LQLSSDDEPEPGYTSEGKDFEPVYASDESEAVPTSEDVDSELVYGSEGESESVYTSEDNKSETEVEQIHYEDHSTGEIEKSLEMEESQLDVESLREEIKYSTELDEILYTQGYYLITGDEYRKQIKVLPQGIEIDNKELLRFEDILSIESFIESEDMERLNQDKSGITGLLSKAQDYLAPPKSTVKIVYRGGEIQIKKVKKKDERRLVSFINRKLKI
jgi:hypothetical protein